MYRARGFGLRSAWACMLFWILAAPAVAAVEPLFDLTSPMSAPFPSNRFAVVDKSNLTGLRVNLPKPDCTLQPSSCDEIVVLNTLDGFNLQPRLRLPFSGLIDPGSVNSSNVFLVRLANSADSTDATPQVIGINQIVWDPSTLTLFAEADVLLEQHTTYALFATSALRDASGLAVAGSAFTKFVGNTASTGDEYLDQYRAALLNALQTVGKPASSIVAASVFTTLSATAEMEKIRDQIHTSMIEGADLNAGLDGTRTVFPLASIQSITVTRQVGTAPSFQTQSLPFQLLNAVPNSVSRIVFGHIHPPDYQTSRQSIPRIASFSGVPVVRRIPDVYFTLVLPVGTRPAYGWPVAIYGHGLGSDKESIVAFASTLAARGIATIGINVPGHGGGELGTITVTRTNGTAVTLQAGGRGIDQNADGLIGITEGVDAAGPRSIIRNRDGMRQVVTDMMALVHTIRTTNTFDVNNDGIADLDPERIYYFGISLGSIYGTMLLALDPAVRAGVLNVPGGAFADVTRTGVFRSLPGSALAARKPSLLNLMSLAPPAFGFDENIPPRNRPPLTNKVSGALEIQDYLEAAEWTAMLGDPLAYARHIRRAPLLDMKPKPVIVQFARGDRTVPNPTTTALLRAGDLADRATFYRHDLAVATNRGLPLDPHTFLAGIIAPATTPVALAAQMQIAEFLASDGTVVVDPDGAQPIFETPIVLPLPEVANFLQ